MTDKLLTVKDVAQGYFQSKVSEREIYALFASGELRGFRVGGKILIYASSLEAYCRGRENRPPAAAPPPEPRAPQGKNGEPPIRLSRLPE
jgi:excisionase family DNA binding protein